MWTFIVAVIGLLTAIVPLFLYYFNSAARKRRAKERIWEEFKAIEAAYREALAVGDPVKAANLAKQMQEMRAKYEFLGES